MYILFVVNPDCVSNTEVLAILTEYRVSGGYSVSRATFSAGDAGTIEVATTTLGPLTVACSKDTVMLGIQVARLGAEPPSP